MPLLDHFHSPLHPQRRWSAFLTAWSARLTTALNGPVLPQDCFAEMRIRPGGLMEVDDEPMPEMTVGSWSPPATDLVLPAVFPDEYEVQICREFGGIVLVGVVVLVSPGNKDQPEHRRAFAAKCSAYLQQGIGLVIVDIVTERSANLHDELISLMEQPADYKFSADASLYAAAYRPSRKPFGDQIELWLNALTLGQALPTMPLPLRGVGTFPLDLEATYQATCRDCRL